LRFPAAARSSPAVQPATAPSLPKQAIMLQKISVEELVPGMYVVDSGLSWLEHPYLYGQEGEVRSLAAVAEIVQAGYTEAFIDTERGLSRGQAAAEPSLAELLSREPQPEQTPAVPLEEELEAAAVVYRDCLCIAREALETVKAGGEVDVETPKTLVDDVIASVVRNSSALVALCKLRRHDAYTFSHGVNVSALSVAFGASLGLDAKGLRELGLAGLFHDIGKTGVSDAILNKPGQLTPVEFEQVKNHPGFGRELLKDRGLPEAVLRGVAEHHEKWGGTGYPLGLAGEDVHPFGRIISVTDVFDALTSKRAYKDGVLQTRALGVLYSMRERDYPPGLVERFIKFMGPYPVGSLVRLSNGLHAFVSRANPSRPLFPELLLAFDRSMGRLRPQKIEPRPGPDGKSPIVEVVDPAGYGIDPLDFLCPSLA
jgi:putative nucleotidyltransferase with HDIG domain